MTFWLILRVNVRDYRESFMSSADHILKKHSVLIAGHSTSISVENIFWRELQQIADSRGMSLNTLIADIDESRDGNLSSAIRVFVMQNRTDGSD